jgi:hypothetical protein
MPRASVRAAILICAAALSAPLTKVVAQHPGGSWHTLETAHFRVHVRPEHRDLGVRVAAEAEAAWAQLAGLLRAPRRRVDLVVADNIDDANGFATTYPLPTIVVYAYPPAGDVQLATYDRWLRLVVVHELAHLFHLDVARGWWGVARTVFGRVPALFPNQYAPTWLIEGTAVFLESRLTPRGRLDGAFHRALVEAQVAEQGRLPIGAAGALSPRWPGGPRAYAFGAEFLGHVTAQHGDSVVPALIDAVSRRPLPYLQLNGALHAAAKVRFGDAWREWMDSLEATDRRTDGPTDGRTDGPTDGRTDGPTDRNDTARTVVCCLRSATTLRASADGRRLLFIHNDGTDVPKLAVWERDSLRARMLARVNGDHGATWLGDDIVAAQLEFTDPYTLRGDLWRVNTRGEERRLTHAARLRDPDAGPDGAIAAVRVLPGGSELVVVRGDSVQVLVAAADGVEWSAPRWARHGFGLVAVRVVDGRHDIVMVDARSGGVSPLTSDVAIDRSPSYDPAGRHVVWSREIGGRPQIVGLDFETGRTIQFTREPFGAYAPAVAGDSLFYFGYHADGFRLEAVPFAGAGPIVLRDGEGPPPPAAVSVPSADSVRTTADSAPPATIVREHGYRPFPALLPQFWLPSLIATEDGAFFGAITTSRDPLGRHAYLADLGIGAGGMRGRWRGLFYYAYAGFAPAVLDFSASREQRAYLLDSANVVYERCCLSDDAVDAGITLARRRWRGTLALRAGAEYERTEQFARRTGINLNLSASRLRAAPLGISAQGGWRAALRLRHRWNATTRTTSSEVVVSGSAYARATKLKFANQVLAARVAAGTLAGGDRVNFGVGGVAGGVFEPLPGVTVGGGGRTFPVRGYPSAYLVGRRALTAAVEFRSPLALVGNGPGFFPPVTLDRLSTAVYFDAGIAWAARYCPGAANPVPTVPASPCANTISSAGAELVVDAGIPYDFPVRFRGGGAWRFALKSAGLYATVGSAF